jgi:CO/xanthine dehydrogenase Mo-binding subunit
VPEITIKIMDSKEPPGGVSGLGHLVLSGSTANAIAAGTGQRLRNCPFDPNGA